MLPTNIVRHGGGEGFPRSSWSANWGAVSLPLQPLSADTTTPQGEFLSNSCFTSSAR
jgi:hypothetical protein